MRSIMVLVFSAAALLAQPRAGTPLYPGGAPGPKSPMPSVVNPGTPTPVGHPFAVGRSGTAPRTGGAGRPGFTGAGRNAGGRGGGVRGGVANGSRRTVYIPYGVPVYGGYGGYYGDNGYNQEEPAPAPQPIFVEPSPPIVYINRDYQPEHFTPQIRDYSNTQLPEAAPPDEREMRVIDNTINNYDRDPDEPTIYLLAFKDQRVIPALAYWVEGDTLHYVTRQHALNVVSLELVDRAFSTQLNRERKVEFKLP
ncbi:MAG: hypothetical protein ABI823_01445 [Bryobacteraceae bacterium]